MIAGQSLLWARNIGADTVIDPDATLSRTAAHVSSLEAAIRNQMAHPESVVTGIPLADTVLRSRVRMPASDADTVITSPRQLSLLDSVAVDPDEESQPSRGSVSFGFTLRGPRHANDQEFTLATPFILGRRPRSPRVSRGQLPKLITVDSPTSAVSGTHLEIRQLGDAVIVTDLGSTNGTRVTSGPGGTQRMPPGSSLVVLPGARVDIGDGNIIEILPVGS